MTMAKAIGSCPSKVRQPVFSKIEERHGDCSGTSAGAGLRLRMSSGQTKL